MDFLLAFTLCVAIFQGYKFQNPDDVSYACNDDEEYNMCGSPCENTCDQKGAIPCPIPCREGCYCKKGLVRSRENYCIPPELCSLQQCGENEEFSDCGSPCTVNCTNYNDPLFCIQQCKYGCFCKPGFIKNSKGKCIHPSECFEENPYCPPNEHYVQCVSTCNDCWSKGRCHQQYQYCQPGCDCKPGYFRNAYGTCVPERLCFEDSFCGENEEYTECHDPCNFCDIQEPCKYPCEPGCDCKKGYHRDDNGLCIPANLCSKVSCRENEEFQECGSLCPRTCDDYQQPHLCSQQCVRGCFCKENYVKSRDGRCVLPTQCPGVQRPTCPRDEQYYICMPTCHNTCETFNSTIATDCSADCRAGCFCKGGLIRRSDGMCVLPRDCPRPLCKEHEEYLECGSPCPITCENHKRWPVICVQQCIEGCFCKAGYVRGPNGTCVQPQYCPSDRNRIILTNPSADPIKTGLQFRRGSDDDDDDMTTKGTQAKTTQSVDKATSAPDIGNKTDDQPTTPSINNKTELTTSMKKDAATESPKPSTNIKTDATTGSKLIETTTPSMINGSSTTAVIANAEMKSSLLTTTGIPTLQTTPQTKAQTTSVTPNVTETVTGTSP